MPMPVGGESDQLVPKGWWGLVGRVRGCGPGASRDVRGPMDTRLLLLLPLTLALTQDNAGKLPLISPIRSTTKVKVFFKCQGIQGFKGIYKRHS